MFFGLQMFSLDILTVFEITNTVTYTFQNYFPLLCFNFDISKISSGFQIEQDVFLVFFYFCLFSTTHRPNKNKTKQALLLHHSKSSLSDGLCGAPFHHSKWESLEEEIYSPGKWSYQPTNQSDLDQTNSLWSSPKITEMTKLKRGYTFH